jgi:hypothetical protein
MSALQQYADGTEKIGGLTSPVTKGGLITGVGAAMSVVGAVGMGFDIYKQASKTLQYNIENLPQVIDKYYGKDGAYKNVFKLFGVPEEYKKDLTGNEGSESKKAETFDMKTMLEFKEKGYSIDYVSLAKAWTEGWRPVDMDTMEVNPIPFSYVTTTSSLMTPEEKKKQDDEMLEKIWSDVNKEEKPRDESDKKYKRHKEVDKKYEMGIIKRELPSDTTGMNYTGTLSDDNY